MGIRPWRAVVNHHSADLIYGGLSEVVTGMKSGVFFSFFLFFDGTNSGLGLQAAWLLGHTVFHLPLSPI